ncbi:MAG: hypothetical protein LBL81_03535 [Tannerella sp.]|jgi:hypothetical protein|nr:hypothetical protein [Tannerella sp.]
MMDSDKLQRIDLLLERFFEGETSKAEEEELYAFFASGEVPERLRPYCSLFKYITDELPRELEAAEAGFTLPRRSRLRFLWRGLVALAAALLLGGLFLTRFLDRKPATSEPYAYCYIRRDGKTITDPALVRPVVEATLQQLALQKQQTDSLYRKAQDWQEQLLEAFPDPYARQAARQILNDNL